MHTIQVGKLKTEFSSILKKVEENGEKFIIEYGKKHKKIAVIVPYNKAFEKNSKRKFGQLNGKIIIPDSFNNEDETVIDMFYGEDN
ncbi:MAG: type II toxin-antitoxin system Phd/YefM family antitoxin [bacterium]|nr:type II toxin-antitoxin system Phd/YefM family antitoxin [bacterium]